MTRSCSRYIDAELELLARCCAQIWSAHDGRPLDLPAEIDWDRFIRIARFHRVAGLVHAALANSHTDFGLHPAKLLSDDARTIAAFNLAIAAECESLKRDFSCAALPVLFLKGLAVAGLAYRAPMLKMSWDIDLLVSPQDLGRAIAVLRARGFAIIVPAHVEKAAAWHEREKESVWFRNSDSLYIELHTRLADNEALIPGLTVFSPRQDVALAHGTTLPTLADEELVAYLAVHGASSAWFRLKWVSDFAALLAGRSGQDIDRLYRRSQDLGAGRAIGQAMLLADRLFGSLEHSPSLRSTLNNDRAVRQLTGFALAYLAAAPLEPTERLLGTWSIHRSQFLLMPSPRFKLSELKRQAAGVLNRLH